MKLDRNTNRGGRGKYALVNMRKLIPILDKAEKWDGIKARTDSDPTDEELAIENAFNILVNRGIISLGNETPGDQFFVMKYKDKFTSAGLRGYAESIIKDIGNLEGVEFKSLAEYAQQIISEANIAQQLGNRIPD